MEKSQRFAKTGTLVLTAAILAAWLCVASQAQDAVSGNKEYAVRHDKGTDSHVVYQVANGKAWYSLPNLPGEFFLSQDGSYAAICNHWLRNGYKKAEVIVQFYRTDKAVTGLTLRDLLKRPKGLRREGSAFRWGKCAGFLRDSVFAIDTVEARRITYEPATGQRSETTGVWPPKPPAETAKAPASQSKLSMSVYASDVYCGDHYIFCDDFKPGLKNGWQQARGKWEVRNKFRLKDKPGDSGGVGFLENVARQNSDQQRESNALLYYDRQNFSDVDIDTFILMDLDFPQLAIDEDERRIRRLRRIAGAGVVFRLQDANNYYMFRLAGEEGAVLGKMVNGEWFDLANPRAVDFLNSNLHYSDRLYGLRVRTRGDRIECWITEWVEGSERSVEQAVVSIRDDSFSTGRIGLVTFEAKADFLFVRVKDL